MEHGAEAIKKQVRVYIAVFAALGTLTVVTVAVSYLHLPFHQALAVALFVATIKGSLVAAYFMHLVSEKKIIYAILILTVVFTLFLFYLPLWTVGSGLVAHVS
ncbi:MAG TPA: cytochrome C oxidase subunit IV family protein [Verrucomicrobiae bacterium]|nr:cytochrome C oxidase subunit IV family protein [Verrucomicrobiae bacterium]